MVTAAKNTIAGRPAIHPSCAILHPSGKTPEPITAVMICAIAVFNVPENQTYQIKITVN